MNIEIGNITLTFELENEVTWQLKKKTRFKIIRLLFSQTLIRSRTSLECSDSLVSIKSSKFTSQICPNISWTVLKEPILRLLSVLLRSSQTSWNLLFFSWSSFLNWWFRYLCWWSEWHSGLSFFWFIGVDIINATCVGINTWIGPCIGSDNYAELR